jgi:phospholipid N-methyltransferase
VSFLREFFRNPRQTGSIAASSGPVVRMLLGCVDVGGARRAVELGAGEGAVTAELRRQLPADTPLLAVELNADFAKKLRRRFTPPGVQVHHRSAVELPDLLAEQDWPSVDLVVSGLPWTLMSARDQADTLDAIAVALAPDGEFVTLACLHQSVLAPGRRLRQQLEDRFGEVHRQPIVWAAVPPMIAYRCAGPIRRVTTDTAANHARP